MACGRFTPWSTSDFKNTKTRLAWAAMQYASSSPGTAQQQHEYTPDTTTHRRLLSGWAYPGVGSTWYSLALFYDVFCSAMCKNVHNMYGNVSIIKIMVL